MVLARRSWWLSVIVVGIGLWTSCSKSDKPTSPNPPGGGGTGGGDTVSVAARAAALGAIDSVSQALDGVTPDSLATALLAFLKTQDVYEAAGREGTSVWARFDDGRMVMIPNNRFPGGPSDNSTADGYPSPGSAAGAQVRPTPQYAIDRGSRIPHAPPAAASQVPSYGLPTSIQGFTTSTLGDQCYAPGAWYAAELMRAHGYQPRFNSAPVIDYRAAMAAYGPFGFFYIDSHGGVCEARDGSFVTGIWTTDDWSDASDAIFKDMLDSGQLVYMYAKGASGGGCADQWRYAFTGRFVAAYMEFSSNSVVYVSACYSDSPSLKAGFKKAGASVYLGWTQPVTDFGSNRAGAFLFDRLLGANDYSLKENPKQRPFDVVSILQDMNDRDLDWDPYTGSELRMTELTPGFGILAPSMRFAYVINYTDTLFLTGYFGPDPGAGKRHVFVDGVEQTVYAWQPTFIWTSIPVSGPGSAGPITVQVDHSVGAAQTHGTKRTSNPINLTAWDGIMSYTVQDAGSLSGEILIHAYFRADVHSFREFPHTVPKPNPYIVFGGQPEWSDQNGEVAGSFIYPVPGSDPYEELTWTWFGKTPDIILLSPSQIFDQPGQLLIQGTVHAASKSMDLMLVATAGGDGWLTETVTSSLYGLQSTNELYLGMPLELYDVFPYQFKVNFAPYWDIAAKTRSFTTCCSVNPGNDASLPDVVHTIQWDIIPAMFPPDSTAAQ